MLLKNKLFKKYFDKNEQHEEETQIGKEMSILQLIDRVSELHN